jgi:hypothetical protein
MAYCTYTEVRRIIDTSLEDADITAIIVLADAEIDARGLDALPDNVKKLISMLISASIITLRDPATKSIAEYREDKLDAVGWRELAENQINRMSSAGELPFLTTNEPID